MASFEHVFFLLAIAAAVLAIVAACARSILSGRKQERIASELREQELRRMYAAKHQPPASTNFGPAEYFSWVPQLISKLDDIQMAQLKQHERLLGAVEALLASGDRNSDKFTRALDALIVDYRKQAKEWRHWIQTSFGGSNTYQDLDDDEAEIRERAESLMQRYGCSYEEAKVRAKSSLVYKPSGMAERG